MKNARHEGEVEGEVVEEEEDVSFARDIIFY